MADRINYVGSALAALDQALNSDPSMLTRSDAAARAQAFAALAIADELRQAREERTAPGFTLTTEEQIGVGWLLTQMADTQKRSAPTGVWRGLRSLANRLEAAS